MENSLQDRVQIVRIYDNVIRTEKRFDNISNNHLRNITRLFKRFCHNIFKQYNSIFEHVERT